MEKRMRKTATVFLIVCAFMLGLAGAGVSAFAEETPTQRSLVAADLFDVGLMRKTLESYDTTYSGIKNQGHYIYKGIELPFSDESKPNSYTLPGTFNGNSEIEYAFSSGGNKANTKFVYKDKSGNELFTIERYYTFGGDYRYVAGARITISGTEILTTKETWDDGKIIPWAYITDDWGKNNVVGHDGLQEDAVSQRAGYIKIEISDSAVNVSLPAKKDTHTYGTDDVTEKTYTLDGSKVSNISEIISNLNSGYTVSVERTEETQQNVLIIAVNGIKFDGSSVNVTNIEPIVQRVVYSTEYEIGGKKYIDSVAGKELSEFAAQNLACIGSNNWQMFITDAPVQAVGYDKDKVGLQKITVSGNEYNVFVAPEISGFDLFDESLSSKTLESYDTTYSELPNQGHYTYKGIELPFSDESKPNSYTLPGVFTGDFDMEYAFSSFSSGGNEKDANDVVKYKTRFVFKNTDGNELFTVVRYTYGNGFQNTRYGGSVDFTVGNTTVGTSIGNFDWGKEPVAYITPWRYITDDWQKGNIEGVTEGKVNGKGEDAIAQRSGHINVSVKSNSVDISFSTKATPHGYGANDVGTWTFALDASKLSGTDANITDIINALNGGYTVSVERTEETQQNVLIIGINGKQLADQAVAYRNMTAEKFEYDGYKDGASDTTLYVAQNGKLDTVTVSGYLNFAGGWKLPFTQKGELKTESGGAVATSATGDQTVNMTATFYGKEFAESATLKVEPSKLLVYETNYGTNGGETVENVYFSEHTRINELPTPVRVGGWTFEGWFTASDFSGEALTAAPAYSAGGGTSVTVYAKWGDYEKPTVALKSGIETLTVVTKGQGIVAASASDVTAEDRAWGVISADGITVEIKVPNATDFESIDDFVFNDTLFGNYTVRYTAKDGSDNVSAPAERIIRYVPQVPVITLSGDKITSGYVNHRIVLPIGTSSTQVTTSVVFDGKQVALTDNGFTPDKVGTYTVAYYAKDEYGQQALETFDIEIKGDTEKPVIEVDFTLENVSVGQEITLPAATATDNADGNISVTVSVTFGDTEVTVDGGKFTPTEAGIYTVTYTATDASGNTESIVREVLASAAQGGKKGCGCKSTVGGGVDVGAAILAIAVCAMFAIRKKRA